MTDFHASVAHRVAIEATALCFRPVRPSVRVCAQVEAFSNRPSVCRASVKSSVTPLGGRLHP